MIGYSSGHVDLYNMQSGLDRGSYGNPGKMCTINSGFPLDLEKSETSMHSSRMRTARRLTLSGGRGGGLPSEEGGLPVEEDLPSPGESAYRGESPPTPREQIGVKHYGR